MANEVPRLDSFPNPSKPTKITLLMNLQNRTTAFVRVVSFFGVTFQLLSCSSQSSSEQVAKHNGRVYLPSLNDSTAMSTVFKLVMDTTYLGIGPNSGQIDDIAPRWLWEAKFDSVIARYPMADISDPGKEAIRVFYTVEHSSKSDSLFNVEYTAEIAEMQKSEGTLGNNTGAATFRKDAQGWYLISNTHNIHLTEDLAASGRQNKLIKSLAAERAVSPETNTLAPDLSLQDKAIYAPDPAIEVSKLRYPIVVSEHFKDYNNDRTTIYPAFITITGEVVDLDKSTRTSSSLGGLHYLLERNGNGTSVPVYTKYKFSKPSRYKIFNDDHPYSSNPEVPTRTWRLLDENNNLITDYKKFPFQRLEITPTSTSAGAASTISYVVENRLWVDANFTVVINGKGSPVGSGASFLINEKGAVLASFPTGTPQVYANGILLLNHNTIIDKNGHVLYKTDNFDIQQVIDDYVMLAYSKTDKPASRYQERPFVYVNYRTGKTLYKAGDYERTNQQAQVDATPNGNN